MAAYVVLMAAVALLIAGMIGYLIADELAEWRHEAECEDCPPRVVHHYHAAKTTRTVEELTRLHERRN